jgi:hypothetical protein
MFDVGTPRARSQFDLWQADLIALLRRSGSRPRGSVASARMNKGDVEPRGRRDGQSKVLRNRGECWRPRLEKISAG